MKNGLTYGTIAGVLYMIWVALGSNISPNLVYEVLPSLTISSILIIIFMFLASQKEKTALDGTIQFGEAFLVCLAVYFMFNLIYGIGFKLYMEASPSAMATFIETQKTSTSNLMKMTGAGEDEIFQAQEQMEDGIKMMLSWKTTFFNLVVGVIFPGAIYALITAGITSKLSKKQA